MSSRLRKTLADVGGNLAIRYDPGACALELDPDCIDVHRFHQLVANGREALDSGQPEVAADHLRWGVALWRGPALRSSPTGSSPA